MKYKKALVTGGAGFIGSHITSMLLDRGIETIVVDNLYMGRKEYVPKGARFEEVDILDREKLDVVTKGVDIIFHNAARVSIRNSVNDVYNDANVNIMGTINVVQSAVKNSVSKLIYASSMAVYGNIKDLPINENASLNPASPYGISKLSAEKYCMQMSKYYGFDAVSLRYFNAYGIRQTLTPYVGVITIFINRLLEAKPPIIFGDGKQIRDFISVDDIVLANSLAMEKDCSGQVFNIGTGNGTSVNDIAKLLISKMGSPLTPVYGPFQKGEPGDSIADIGKAVKGLGFSPRFKLAGKINEIIEWNKREASMLYRG